MSILKHQALCLNKYIENSELGTPPYKTSLASQSELIYLENFLIYTLKNSEIMKIYLHIHIETSNIITQRPYSFHFLLALKSRSLHAFQYNDIITTHATSRPLFYRMTCPDLLSCSCVQTGPDLLSRSSVQTNVNGFTHVYRVYTLYFYMHS